MSIQRHAECQTRCETIDLEQCAEFASLLAICLKNVQLSLLSSCEVTQMLTISLVATFSISSVPLLEL